MSTPSLAGINPRLLALIPTVSTGVVDDAPVGTFWMRVNVAIGTGNTNIRCGLPRVPSGYIVTRNRAGGIVQDGDTTQWAAGNINLKASVAGNYDLWVF